MKSLLLALGVFGLVGSALAQAQTQAQAQAQTQAQVQAVSPPPAELREGEAIYRQVCMACHAGGVAQAPRVGDRPAWARLQGEGQAMLTAHGWVGVRGMPAQGGRVDLSLEEFARATAWMARASGLRWADPDAAMMARIRQEEAKRRAQLARGRNPS